MPSGAPCLANIAPAQNPSALPYQMPPGSPVASSGTLRSQTLPSYSRPVPSHDTLLHLNCVLIPTHNLPAILNTPTPRPFSRIQRTFSHSCYFLPPTLRFLLCPPDPLCVSSLLQRMFFPSFFSPPYPYSRNMYSST